MNDRRIAKDTNVPSTDCISRQAAIDALRVAYWDDNIQSAKDDPCIVDAMTDWAIRQVKALPTAQPERMSGRWENGYCNQCGEHALYWAMSSGYCASKFCPSCGAQMTEGEE